MTVHLESKYLPQVVTPEVDQGIADDGAVRQVRRTVRRVPVGT